MSAWYVKNVPIGERVVRVVVGLGGAVAAVLLVPGVMGWVAGASVAGLALTGLVGFCPMCAMVGRKPVG
ncbi:YgaP-like transmembrane domain [Rhodoferax saidenbachensis]|uniref:Inner membrane protein YgaP-like transmembrane domain-containing protein n=1 Tax=Rhodoferax saidenbachensis TaxID=1484693 RepID=A0ABU1ZP29_9BURK|nr:YgaP-like transmembrane domain [Rhodoferax saidenbachensis]MDR7307309.1 hypothetical protein [Rhodoferax saidenbachensis]